MGQHTPGTTCIRIRPSGEAAPLAPRKLGCSAPAGQVPKGAPLCSGGVVPYHHALLGLAPSHSFSPRRPRRSVPGEAGTPCPSEGSGPRRIQSRTAALCCLNWRRGCWQALVPPRPAPAPGTGARGHAWQ